MARYAFLRASRLSPSSTVARLVLQPLARIASARSLSSMSMLVRTFVPRMCRIMSSYTHRAIFARASSGGRFEPGHPHSVHALFSVLFAGDRDDRRRLSRRGRAASDAFGVAAG